jgi:hypothetical protein
MAATRVAGSTGGLPKDRPTITVDLKIVNYARAGGQPLQ